MKSPLHSQVLSEAPTVISMTLLSLHCGSRPPNSTNTTSACCTSKATGKGMEYHSKTVVVGKDTFTGSSEYGTLMNQLFSSPLGHLARTLRKTGPLPPDSKANTIPPNGVVRLFGPSR
eukprot:scaffold624_cov402-Prasinococcus_capsulatus_cf.AAC.63